MICRNPFLEKAMSTIESYEYVFLGGGKGGKSLAMELAKAGKRVAVVEQGMIGGSCINVACIPSKALIQSARVMHAVQSAAILQEPEHDARVDMALVHQRVRGVVDGMVDINMNMSTRWNWPRFLGT
jgi:pyruvate/2-oxoglutarate dehydrogenase complex dihydrolipoamide dehydrogenase (E3) component